MSTMKNVHRHLRQAHQAHRKTEEEALRAAAIARAEADAARAAQASTHIAPEGGSDG
jgi:hypothetical protein